MVMGDGIRALRALMRHFLTAMSCVYDSQSQTYNHLYTTKHMKRFMQQRHSFSLISRFGCLTKIYDSYTHMHINRNIHSKQYFHKCQSFFDFDSFSVLMQIQHI